ncbi:MAG: hypothetical protein ACI35T_07510 [Alistipes sp.]
MKELKDIREDQIRIVGEGDKKNPLPRNAWIIIVVIIGGVVIGLAVWAVVHYRAVEMKQLKEPEPSYFEPERGPEQQPESATQSVARQWIGREVDSLAQGFTEIRDTTINDIPIRIFIPHNAEMSLHIGKMDKADDIIYAAQAADVRADNGGIVGAFVLKGVPRAWGLSKKGFCASINGEVTIGVAENSPLFEKATEQGGYFFRQYPLVSNGQLIDNEPKGKAIRRAICDRQGEIFMVETGSAESFHDFAQALVDLGVDQAVYLVGSLAYGWAVDENGSIYEFGEDNRYTGRRKRPRNTSYVVWKRKI